MKLRFLHLADLHLGCKNFYLAEKSRERSEDFKLAFRDAVEFALDSNNAIDGVLISGNLFEYHRPDPALWGFAQGLLSRLLAKNILVAMIPGTHDSYAYKNSVYRTERLPGVDLILDTTPGKPIVHDIRGTRVFLYGLAFVPGQTPTPLPRFNKVAEKGVHIAMVHGQVEDFGAEDAPHRLALNLNDLSTQGFDYLALGGQSEFAERDENGCKAVFPGNLEGRSFAATEAGARGPVIVEFDDNGCHIERILNNRKSIDLINIDLRDEHISDAESLKNAIAAFSNPRSIAQVTLTGTSEFLASLDDLCDELDEGFFHLEINDESRVVDSALLRKIDSENTIRGYFVRKLSERLEAIKAKIIKQGQTDALLRELKVCELAIKRGVEQFVEEEAPADSIYSLIPDSQETVEADTLKDAIGVNNLEDRVKAMLEHRRKKNQELDPMSEEDSASLSEAEEGMA